MDDLERSLHDAAGLIARYRRGAPTARVGPEAGRDAVAAALDPALPGGPTPLPAVIDELVAGAAPGLVRTPGPRYFGFVVGGSLDAAVVADVLTTGWDQNAFNAALSPAALAFEDVAGAWLKELLRSPGVGVRRDSSRAPARPTPWASPPAGRTCSPQHGWDVGRDGLHGAPRIRIVRERRAARDDRPGAPAARAGRRIHRDPAGRRQRRDGPARAREVAAGRSRPACRPSSAHRPATSTPARATTCARSAPRPASTGRGCTSTARSASGRRRARGRRRWSTASSWPTRGAATGTSG